MKNLCKCGCGQITNPGKTWIYKHNLKGVNNPNYGNYNMSAKGKENI